MKCLSLIIPQNFLIANQWQETGVNEFDTQIPNSHGILFSSTNHSHFPSYLTCNVSFSPTRCLPLPQHLLFYQPVTSRQVSQFELMHQSTRNLSLVNLNSSSTYPSSWIICKSSNVDKDTMYLSIVSFYLKLTALSLKRLFHKFPQTERMWVYFH